MLGQSWQDVKDIQQILTNTKWDKHMCLQMGLVWKNA